MPSAETVLQRADVAMYLAKTDHSGICVYTPDRDRHTHERVTLISELREALAARQFFLEYQPITHLRTGIVVGVEALVRWNHPKLGRIMPGGFVDLAEQTGLSDPLTMIVLDTALAEWSGVETITPLTISVNAPWRTPVSTVCSTALPSLIVKTFCTPAKEMIASCGTKVTCFSSVVCTKPVAKLPG